MLELRVSADDGLFSGVTQVYTTWESLRDLRSRLRGFPRSTNDVVDELIGAPGGYSYLRLRFHCIDGSGHAKVEVELQKSEQQDGALDCRPQLKTYVLFEPAAMDNFVSQIDVMISAKGGAAKLVGHDA